ncbi:MAG: CoA transferase [Vicinamibacterales bacterium]
MTPLDGLLVVDLTRVLSGPYCTMMLADMGARVIKVEQPGKGDDTRGWGPPFHRRRERRTSSASTATRKVSRSTSSKPEGRELLERLIARADVLVENFRPGTLDKARARRCLAARALSASDLLLHLRASATPVHAAAKPGTTPSCRPKAG